MGALAESPVAVDAGAPVGTTIDVAQCTQSGAGAPSLTVTVPTSIEKGSGMTIGWNLTGATATSSIAFFVRRNVPDGERWAYPGATGPLTLVAKNVCATASGTAVWDGRSVGCAPTDFPTLCTGVEPGEYVIEAAVYGEADYRIVRGLEPSSPTPPTIVATATSAPFQITGEPNLAVARSRMRGAVSEKIRTFMNAYAYAGTKLERYAEPECELSGPDSSGLYCGLFHLAGPVEGTLRPCAALRSDVKVVITGDIAVPAGVLTYEQALASARAVADAPYLSRVGGGTTLSAGVTNWAYRSDGGYWAFIVHEIKAGGSESGPDRFADNVLVRVNDDGQACVIKTVEYKQSVGVDIFTGAIACP